MPTKKALATALVVTFCMSAPAWADPLIIKFSHVVSPDTPKGKGADKFKELAEQYTDGKVVVEVYPNSQLYKDKEELEALQLGAVHMLAPSLAKFGPLGVRAFEVFDLPFIFESKEDLNLVTQGQVGQDLLTMLEPKGIKGLAYWDNGFKIMSANSPLHTPDDFLGLKMRIQSSKVLEAQMQALEAIPQVMAFSESYQALQTGVVDGTENTPSNLYTQKMHEVQKHATLSNHGYIGYAVIVNKRFWDTLDPTLREPLEKAMVDATTYANEISQLENDEALEAIRAAGRTTLYELSPHERREWVAALRPVHDVMASRIGPEVIESIYRTLQR